MKILFTSLLVLINLAVYSQSKGFLEKGIELDEVRIKALPLKTFIQKGRSPLLPILTYQVQVVDPSYGGPTRWAHLNKMEPFSKKTVWISSVETKLEPFSNEQFDVFFMTMQIVGADTVINRKVINGSEIKKDKYTLYFNPTELTILPQVIFMGLEIVPKRVDIPIMYPLFAANNSHNLYLYHLYKGRADLIKHSGMGVTFNFKIKYHEQ